MSHTELHAGKLKKVDLEEKKLEKFCEDKCKEAGIEKISSYNHGWVDQFNDRFWYGNKKKYFVH